MITTSQHHAESARTNRLALIDRELTYASYLSPVGDPRPEVVVQDAMALVPLVLLVWSCGGEGDSAPTPVATQLAFATQPTVTTAGRRITPAVRVTVQDAGGSTVSTASDPVTLTLNSIDTSAKVSGTTTATASGGVAAFTDLAVNKPGTFTFAATSPNLTTATSVVFDIVPTTVPPAAPDGLSATASSMTEIDLAWADSAFDVVGIQVEQAPGGTTSFAAIGTVAAGTNAFQSTGLQAGTAYSYRIRAYNAAGASPYSNVATATTAGVVTDVDGTWTLQPSLSSDCILFSLHFGTVTTLKTAPDSLTFTLKGIIYPDAKAFEVPVRASLSAGQVFAASGSGTFPYGSLDYVLDGHFTSNRSFTADVQIAAGYNIGGAGASCGQSHTTVIGTRR